MSTSPQSGATPFIASADPLAAALKKALSAADLSASGTVQNLKLVHQARLAQLTRTAAALKAQYGARDPRVVAAEAAVTARTSIVARLAAASRQAATPIPTIAATGWALHGRVYDAQLQPVGGFVVFVVDAQKIYQQQYGFAYTDDTGYFLISYTPPSGQAPSSVALYIEIANRYGEPIFLSTAAFQPVPGSTTYQNIMLPAGEKPLGDLPPEIKKIAVPEPPPGSKS